MNIFLDKSLPKRTQVLLQILRVVLLVSLFGGIYYASIKPEAGDILLYASTGLAIIFLLIKFIIDKRKKRIANNAEQNYNSTRE